MSLVIISFSCLKVLKYQSPDKSVQESKTCFIYFVSLNRIYVVHSFESIKVTFSRLDTKNIF